MIVINVSIVINVWIVINVLIVINVSILINASTYIVIVILHVSHLLQKASICSIFSGLARFQQLCSNPIRENVKSLTVKAFQNSSILCVSYSSCHIYFA